MNIEPFFTPTFEISRFTYTKSSNSLAADTSDLEMNRTPSHIDILSPKTGVTIRFDLDRIERNEGEVLYWEYTSEAVPVKVLLFND